VAPGEFRLRVCYAKSGRLRFLSHLEVLRAMERVIRRADLPVAVTQGFNPHMKIAFGPALPVGTAGEREYLDVWLTRYTGADEVLARLVGASPAALAPIEARYVGGSEPSLTAAATIAVYVVTVNGEGSGEDGVRAALDRLVATGSLEIEHKGKQKVYDLAQSLPKEPDVRVSPEGATLVSLTVRMGPQGSLRPEVFVRRALESAELPAAVASVTRLDTLIETESGWARPV